MEKECNNKINVLEIFSSLISPLRAGLLSLWGKIATWCDFPKLHFFLDFRALDIIIIIIPKAFDIERPSIQKQALNFCNSYASVNVTIWLWGLFRNVTQPHWKNIKVDTQNVILLRYNRP